MKEEQDTNQGARQGCPNAQQVAGFEIDGIETAPANHTITLSVARNAKDTRPRKQTWRPCDFTKYLERLASTDHLTDFEDDKGIIKPNDKRSGVGFFGRTFDGKGKNGSNVTTITAILLDFDDINNTIFQEMLGRLNCQYWAHTTYSHNINSDLGRWRLIVPLAQPLDVQQVDYESAVNHIRGGLLDILDPQDRLPAKVNDNNNNTRLAFAPSKPPGAPARNVIAHAGPFLQVTAEDIPAFVEPVSRPLIQQADLDPSAETRVRSALSHLEQLASDREHWIRFGQALKNSYGDAAFDVWHDWSIVAPGADNTDDLKRRWAGFTEAQRKRPVTVASIFFEARNAGWNDPKPSNSVAMIGPFDGQRVDDLATAREKLKQLVDRLREDGTIKTTDYDVLFIAADTELGKTTTMLNLLVEIFEICDGDLSEMDAFVFTFPSYDLCKGKLAQLLRRAEARLSPALYSKFESAVVLDVGRRKSGAHRCERFEDYSRRRAVDPREAGAWCNNPDGCGQHARYMDVESRAYACPWSQHVEDNQRKSPFITIRTHAMHRLKLPEDDGSGDVVQWSDMLEQWGFVPMNGDEIAFIGDSTIRYKDRLEKTSKGGRRLTIIEDASGIPAPNLDEDEHLVLDDGKVKLTQPGKVAVLRWLMDARAGGRGELAFDDSYHKPLERVERDGVTYSAFWDAWQDVDTGVVCIHDETIADHISPTVSVTIDDMRTLLNRGVITGEDARSFLDTIDTRPERGQLLSLDDLGLAAPAWLWCEDAERQYSSELMGLVDRGEDLPDDAVSHEARAAARAIIEGEYFNIQKSKPADDGDERKDKLTTIIRQRFFQPHAKMSIFMDATTNAVELDVLLRNEGMTLKAEQLRARPHDESTCFYIQWDQPRAGELADPAKTFCKNDTRDDKPHATDSRNLILYRAKNRLVEAVAGSKSILLGTRKRYTPDLEDSNDCAVRDELASFMSAADAGRHMIHHNGSLARGSGAFEHVEVVCADSYKVPRHSIEARAQFLYRQTQMLTNADRHGLDHRAGDLDFWRGVARYSLEGAPIEQLAQRIRTRGNARAVIICGTEEIPGLAPTHDPITPDALSMAAVVAADDLGAVGARGIIPDAARWILHQVGYLPVYDELAHYEQWLSGLDLGNLFELQPVEAKIQNLSRTPLIPIVIYRRSAGFVTKLSKALLRLAEYIEGRNQEVPLIGVTKLTAKVRHENKRQIKMLIAPEVQPSPACIERAARAMNASAVEVDGAWIFFEDLDWSSVDWSASSKNVWGQIQALLQVNNPSTARRALEARGLPTKLKDLKEAVAPVEALPELDLSTFDSEEDINKIAIMRHYKKSRWADAVQCLKDEGYDGTLDELREFWREDREEDQAIKDERSINRYSVVDERPTAPRHVKTPELLQAAGSPSAPRPVWDDASNPFALPDRVAVAEDDALIDEVFGPSTPAEVAKAMRGFAAQLEKSRKTDVLTFRAADPHLQPLEYAYHQWSSNPWASRRMDFDSWCAHLRLHVGDWSFDLLPVGPRHQWIENTIRSAIDSLVRDEGVPIEQLAHLDGQWRIDDHDAGLEPVGVGWYLPIDQAA